MIDSRDRIPGITLVTILLVLAICFTITTWLSRPIVRDRDGAGVTDPATWPDMRINVNTADEAELALLPGIGPRLAERIVDYRREHGPFATIEDLTTVKWVGSAMVERIEPFVVVEPP